MAMKGQHRFEPDTELSDLFTKMLEEDDNKCNPEVDFSIDVQGAVTTGARRVGGDKARDPLFTWVSEDALERDTYKAFIALLDNYESELGEPEIVDREEVLEMREFINLIMTKEVMQTAHRFLVDKELAPPHVNNFKCLLYNMWFRLIRRTKGDRDFDSSSFEHVFVGETKGREVKGLHNWIQFYLQEKLGNIDYKGYFRRDTILHDKVPRLLTIQFTWKGDIEKPIGTVFLGTSPEFEIGVFTILRLMEAKKSHVQLGEYETEITCYPLGNGVGTAYIGAART